MRFSCTPKMTSSIYLHYGALCTVFNDRIWKGSNGFLLVFYGNFTSIMHRFQDNDVFLQFGNDVIANHGCTLVQAVVMVTTVLIGNRHFWTAGNKKPKNQCSPNFAQVSIVNLCANFGSNRLRGDFSAHAINLTLLSLFNALSIFPSLSFFLALIHRPNAWTNIYGSWLKRRALTRGSALWVCEWWKKHIRGVYSPKNCHFFQPDREITAKTLMINNFQTVRFSHLLLMDHL